MLLPFSFFDGYAHRFTCCPSVYVSVSVSLRVCVRVCVLVCLCKLQPRSMQYIFGSRRCSCDCLASSTFSILQLRVNSVWFERHSTCSRWLRQSGSRSSYFSHFKRSVALKLLPNCCWSRPRSAPPKKPEMQLHCVRWPKSSTSNTGPLCAACPCSWPNANRRVCKHNK